MMCSARMIYLLRPIRWFVGFLSTVPSQHCSYLSFPLAVVLVQHPLSALSWWLGWCLFVSTLEWRISDDVYCFDAPCFGRQNFVVTVLLNMPDFWVTIFCELVISMIPSQGTYRGNRSRCTYHVPLYSLKSCNWLNACSFSNVCPPLSEKQATCRKNPCNNISLKQKNTCAQLATAISKRIQTSYGKAVCQHSTHTACQMQVWRAFRDFN
jgi:hypothetical protein